LATNNTADVPGAQTGTLRKCPSTKRQVNPLNPTYTLPGESELGPGFENKMFGEGPSSSMDSKYVQIQKKIEREKEQGKPKIVKELVKDEKKFKQDMAKFYAVPPQETRDIDLGKVQLHPVPP